MKKSLKKLLSVMLVMILLLSNVSVSHALPSGYTPVRVGAYANSTNTVNYNGTNYTFYNWYAITKNWIVANTRNNFVNNNYHCADYVSDALSNTKTGNIYWVGGFQPYNTSRVEDVSNHIRANMLGKASNHFTYNGENYFFGWVQVGSAILREQISGSGAVTKEQGWDISMQSPYSLQEGDVWIMAGNQGAYSHTAITFRDNNGNGWLAENTGATGDGNAHKNTFKELFQPRVHSGIVDNKGNQAVIYRYFIVKTSTPPVSPKFKLFSFRKVGKIKEGCNCVDSEKWLQKYSVEGAEFSVLQSDGNSVPILLNSSDSEPTAFARDNKFIANRDGYPYFFLDGISDIDGTASYLSGFGCVAEYAGGTTLKVTVPYGASVPVKDGTGEITVTETKEPNCGMYRKSNTPRMKN